MSAVDTHKSQHLALAERHLHEAVAYIVSVAEDADDETLVRLKQIATRLRTEANNVSRVRASGLGAAS